MERLKTMAILALLAALAGSIALAATGGEAEVRINARQLEDGRVEFALQQRVDGEWGDRILPRSRYFPTGSDGRWLNSSPLTVSAAEAVDVLEEGEPATPATPSAETTTTDGDRTGITGTAIWYTEIDDFTDERRVVAILSSENSGVSYLDPVLVVRCTGEKLEVFVSDLPTSTTSDNWSVLLRWGDRDPERTTWSENSVSGDAHFAIAPRAYWLGWIRVADTLRVRVTGFSQTVTARFNLADLKAVPVWYELSACGL